MKLAKKGSLPAVTMDDKESLSSGFLDVGSLRTFRSLHNLELDYVSFLQSPVTVTDYGRVVNEHIRAIVAPDKAVPFCVIEPFYDATQASASLNKCFSFRPATIRRERCLPEIARSLAERECQSIVDAILAKIQDEYSLRYKTV
jgi:hypothetical protein